MNAYDVYIVSPKLDRPLIVPAQGNNPDDALTDCQRRADYVPEVGDRVIRCVEVDRHVQRS